AALPSLGCNPGEATALTVGPDGTVYAAPGPVGTVTIVNNEPAFSETSLNVVARLGPGTATLVAGRNGLDPATGTQSGYGPGLAIEPNGIAATADNAVLISSGHNVYRLEDADTAQPWSGTPCDPAALAPPPSPPAHPHP